MQQTVKRNLAQLKDLALKILPQNKTELILFISLVLAYVSYSCILVFQTKILYYPANGGFFYDLILGFDHLPYFHHGYTDIFRHPLILIITKPLLFIGSFVNQEQKALLSIFLCSSLVSLSIIYVYRYIKDIIKLKGYTLFLITIFYSFFGSNLILCFTSEAFTISLFLLSFTIYYYSLLISQKREVHLLTNICLAISLGGVTITNLAKGIIPILFTNSNTLIKIRNITIIGILFSLIMYISYSVCNLQLENSIEDTSRYIQIINLKTFIDPLFFKAYYFQFFSAPILLPEIRIIDVYIGLNSHYHLWAYLLISLIYIAIFTAIVKNYKNKAVQMLCVIFSINIFIHLIMGFSIIESFIYAGHWIYIIPLFLGWFYKSLSKKHYTLFSILLTCIFIILCINNVIRMIDFINHAIEIYPTK